MILNLTDTETFVILGSLQVIAEEFLGKDREAARETISTIMRQMEAAGVDFQDWRSKVEL